MNPNAEYGGKNGKRAAVILPPAEYRESVEDWTIWGNCEPQRRTDDSTRPVGVQTERGWRCSPLGGELSGQGKHHAVFWPLTCLD